MAITPSPSDLPQLTPSSTTTPSTPPDQEVGGLTPAQQEMLAEWAVTKLGSMKAARLGYEAQWRLNMNFYGGKHYTEITRGKLTGYKVQTIKSNVPWRVRAQVNKVRRIVRTEIAKLVAQKPRFTVVPGSTDDDDIMAARAAEHIFTSVWDRFKMERTMRQVLFWTTVTGNGYIKVQWDKDKKDPTEKTPKDGDFDICVVSPFHVYVPNLREVNLQDQPYIFHVTQRSQDWISARYKNITLKPQSSDWTQDSLNESPLFPRSGTKPVVDDMVEVIEVWIRPGQMQRFPDGAAFTIINHKVLQFTDSYPYDHNQFPFHKIGHVPSGVFYETSILEDLIPLQREFNRGRSQIIEDRNMTARPQMMAQQGSIDVSKMTAEPGQVILYAPGMNPPTPLPLTPLPGYVLELQKDVSGDMDDISGQHDISRGNNPSQVTAATALSFLQEQDDTMLSDTVSSIEMSLELIGQQVLALAIQFWDSERMVKVVGKDGSVDARLFSGENLGGNTDLRVESGSGLPQSKAAKQAFIMDLIKLGVIPGQVGLQVLDIGGIDAVLEDFNTDQRQIQRENVMMLNGEKPTTSGLAQEWDNHALHIAGHNNFRKSQQFFDAPQEVKNAFSAHVQSHQAAIAHDQAVTMAQQQPQGAPAPALNPGPTALPVGAPPALPQGA